MLGSLPLSYYLLTLRRNIQILSVLLVIEFLVVEVPSIEDLAKYLGLVGWGIGVLLELLVLDPAVVILLRLVIGLRLGFGLVDDLGLTLDLVVVTDLLVVRLQFAVIRWVEGFGGLLLRLV